MMEWDAGKFEREWKKLNGKRAELDIGKSYIHEMLDESKKRQFDAAWNAWIAEHPEQMQIKELKGDRDALTGSGDYEAAVDVQDQINELLNTYK